MPSLRHPLSPTEKVAAMYSDPAQYTRARAAATERGIVPGSDRYRREVTYFLVDAEILIHGGREATAAQLRDHDLWQLRRELCLNLTGEDLLLSAAPNMESIKKWRRRILPTPVERTGPNGEELNPAERQDQLAKAYKAGLPPLLTRLVDVHEASSLALADQVRILPAPASADLTQLTSEDICSADGTWISPLSGVEAYVTRDRDSETNEETFEVAYSGSRADKDRTRRLATALHNSKPHGPNQGINHVAILTRTAYGRIILSLERAMGGEVRAAMTSFDRIAAKSPGRFKAMCYDKALNGWPVDYLLARHGVLSIRPLAGKKSVHPDMTAADDLAKEILAETHAVLNAPKNPSNLDGPKRVPKFSKSVKIAVAARLLEAVYSHEIEALVADIDARRPVGRGLSVGECATLNSRGELLLIKSQHAHFDTWTHQAGAEDCEHQIKLDDGALWDTRLERGLPVKDQRVICMAAVPEREDHTGWMKVTYTFQLICERTGEILTREKTHRPSGKRYHSRKKRRPIQDVQTVSRCDPNWAKLYGLRNDCESWFSWLKQQLPQYQQAASLDLNHQLLDLLHAAALTNSITHHHYQLERHLHPSTDDHAADGELMSVRG